MRIDKLLWYLRFTRSRGLAQGLVEAGHIRLNGKRVERCAQAIAPGDILVLPLGNRVQVARITTVPARRGPASEARACYQVLDETRAFPIAAGTIAAATEEDLQP